MNDKGDAWAGKIFIFICFYLFITRSIQQPKNTRNDLTSESQANQDTTAQSPGHPLCNLRSGVPYIFCRDGKVRLIQLTICLLLVQNLDFSLIGQETKGYLELSHDWLPLWRYDFR